MKVILFFNIYNMGICNRCGRKYPASSPFGLFDSSLCISCNAKIKYDKKYSIDKEEKKNNDVDRKAKI